MSGCEFVNFLRTFSRMTFLDTVVEDGGRRRVLHNQGSTGPAR